MKPNSWTNLCVKSCKEMLANTALGDSENLVKKRHNKPEIKRRFFGDLLSVKIFL